MVFRSKGQSRRQCLGSVRNGPGLRQDQQVDDCHSAPAEAESTWGVTAWTCSLQAMRRLHLKRKSATALGVCFGQTGGDRKAQAAGLDCLPPGILGLTDGVLRPPAATLAKAADWPFQKSGIRVRSGHLRSTKNFNNFQTDRFTSRFDPFILETDPFTFQIDSLHFLI